MTEPRHLDSATPVARLAALVSGGEVMVLSGAGLSTESGIPDYRGETGASRPRTPMTFQTFVGDPWARRRYWARSHVGWRTIAGAAPNAGHHAVTALQRAGLLAGVVTQNVDGLHQAASATNVVDLHGTLDRVICLDCGDLTRREDLDTRLRLANDGFAARVEALNPDGDVELHDDQIAGFRTVDCTACGTGMLKPDVVFFGENVPAARVQRAHELVRRAKLVLVLGSSLAVMSGRRFVFRAAKLGVPVAIVNQGPTRGDPYASLVIDGKLGQILPRLVTTLSG